ncbi:MAG: tandem-95 repeat protein, partial [Bacteroidetes bacterium]|nr:tandem-95 repeat protein [Bacteroidota bacterium]
PAPVLCDQALVTITVSNEAPTANNDAAVVLEDGSVMIAVLANDTDPQPNLDTASVVVVSGPSNGSTTVSALTGVVTYTPDANFNGIDLFEYRVCDLDGFCDQALVTITVSPVNDAPVVQSDVAITAEDTPITTVVLANDGDPFDAPSGMDPTSVTILTPPSNGSVFVNPLSGTITYTPNPDFNGVDFYGYQACDLGVPLPALCDPANVLVTVTPVNDAPVVVDDASTTPEDVAVAISVLANDSDVEDGTLVPASVVVLTAPAHGTALVNPATGVITYTPSLHYNGPDAFGYQACDSEGACDAATVNITVTPVNDPPLVIADAATTAEDTPVIIAVLANDSDANDPGGTLNPATVTVTAGPSNGTVLVNPGTGQITYTPSPDYEGTDAFTYSVCDNGIPLPALCGSAVVTFTVTPTNDAPLVLDDAVTTPEDIAIAIVVLANDSDVEEGTLVPASVVVLTPPSQGTALVNPATGVITYTPALHYNGPDLFTYQACDSEGACASATVSISVSPVNDAPVILGDAATTLEDTPVLIPVIDNDSDAHDPGGTLNPASVVVTSGPTNGTAVVNLITGVVTYTPSPDYYGPDAFTYSVCDNGTPLPALCGSAVVTLTVNPVNDAPIALDDVVSTPEGVAVVADVLANDNDDADPDGGLDVGSVIVLDGPSNGTVLVNALTGELTYTPNPGFGGVDTVVYQVCDLGFPLPALCNQALLIITVSDQSPTAVDDAATLLEDGSVVVPVLANDTDPQDNLDPTSVTLVLLPSLGGAVVNPVSGDITYTPFANLNGADFLDYRVCDLTGYCDVARLNLTISPVNDAPQVLNDNSTTAEETPVATPVLANDSDPHDAPLGGIDPGSITFVIGPSNGSVVSDPFSGVITYTPDLDYFGFDSYTYRVCDLGFPLPPLCADGLVVITVTPVDDPYLAVDDFFSTPTGTAINLPVLANDIDPDGDVELTSVQVVVLPLHGSATALVDGTVDYAPDAGYFGLDSLRYGACDVNGNCDSAWVVLSMDAIPPVAINDSLDALPGQPTVLDVLANDQPGDSPLDPGSVTILLNPTSGSVSVDPVTGEVTYSPDPGFCGLDAFGYQVCDERDLCSSALVVLNVLCIDLEAVADAVQTGFETALLIDVLNNDSPNADPACLLLVEAPANGSAEVQPDGQILYSPDAAFSGTDCFVYSVCDTTESLIATAEVCVEVLPEVVLQVPVAFSPNGDGFNDLLVIPGVLQYPDCELTIFNRWESRVFQAKGYDNSWDGRWEGNGEALPDGTYFFILRLNPDDPNGDVRSGAINIIR